ncbi:MAG: ATP-binding protein [Patescibacteria group bacterium]
MTIDNFKRIIESGKESISLEFKESESWDSSLKNKLTKFILAATNTREGGNLIVGIDNSGKLVGVKAEHLTSYKEDVIKDYVSRYADPYANFSVDIVEHESKNYVVFTVREFSEMPVICKKEGDGFRKGAIYIRTRNRRPETVEVPDSAHMRELVELATDKMNENLKKRGWNRAISESAANSFLSQIEDLNI